MNLSGVRVAVLERDGYRCGFCRKPAGTIDHIMSAAECKRQGIKRYDKLWIIAACLSCNLRKGSRRLVPVGYPHITELRELTGKKWREWDGGKPVTEVLI